MYAAHGGSYATGFVPAPLSKPLDGPDPLPSLFYPLRIVVDTVWPPAVASIQNAYPRPATRHSEQPIQPPYGIGIVHQLLNDIKFYDETLRTEKNQAPTASSTQEYASPSISEPRNAWEVYNERVKQEDSDMVHTLNGNMDALLAGLFSAVVTAFLATTLDQLQEHPQDVTNQLLLMIIARMDNSSGTFPLRDHFSPSKFAVWVNSLFLGSICSSLLAALGAILVKQWARQYEIGISGISSPQVRARTRHFRFEGIVRWHLSDIEASIPALIHFALFLFFSGLIILLARTQTVVAIVVGVFLTPGALFYIVTAILPILFPAAPFRSPATSLIGLIARVIQYFGDILKPRPRSFSRSPATSMYSTASKSDRKSQYNRNPLQQKQIAQINLVRFDWKRDLDVISTLILSADEITERNVLESCLVKLQDLFIVASEQPHAFYRTEIIDCYHLLAGTCIHHLRLEENPTLWHPKIGRARNLCRFLIWLTTLNLGPRAIEKAYVAFPPSTSHLPQALLDYGFENGNLDDVLLGKVALLTLSHLHSNIQPCLLCLLSSEDVVYRYLMRDMNREAGRNSDRLKKLIALWVAQQDRCVSYGRHPSNRMGGSIILLGNVLAKFKVSNADFPSKRQFASCQLQCAGSVKSWGLALEDLLLGSS